MNKCIVSLPLGIDEDVHNEFRMHTKLQITELGKFQSKQDKDGSIRRTLQPISKTICSFLNTDGGRLFLGVNDDKEIKGITMSKNMIYHFFGSLRHMCEKFKPFNPLSRIQVSILEVVPLSDPSKVKLQKVNLEKQDSTDFPKMASHSIGGSFCDCFNEVNQAATKQYLLIVRVAAPDPKAPTVIFQNEEGLAYRRRLASNKCVYLDDLRRMMEERKGFVDLHDEVRHEIDRFIKFN